MNSQILGNKYYLTKDLNTLHNFLARSRKCQLSSVMKFNVLCSNCARIYTGGIWSQRVDRCLQFLQFFPEDLNVEVMSCQHSQFF